MKFKYSIDGVKDRLTTLITRSKFKGGVNLSDGSEGELTDNLTILPSNEESKSLVHSINNEELVVKINRLESSKKFNLIYATIVMAVIITSVTLTLYNYDFNSSTEPNSSSVDSNTIDVEESSDNSEDLVIDKVKYIVNSKEVSGDVLLSESIKLRDEINIGVGKIPSSESFNVFNTELQKFNKSIESKNYDELTKSYSVIKSGYDSLVKENTENFTKYLASMNVTYKKHYDPSMVAEFEGIVKDINTLVSSKDFKKANEKKTLLESVIARNTKDIQGYIDSLGYEPSYPGE